MEHQLNSLNPPSGSTNAHDEGNDIGSSQSHLRTSNRDRRDTTIVERSRSGRRILTHAGTSKYENRLVSPELQTSSDVAYQVKPESLRHAVILVSYRCADQSVDRTATRITGVSHSASSIAGSLSAYHCCSMRIRGMVSSRCCAGRLRKTQGDHPTHISSSAGEPIQGSPGHYTYQPTNCCSNKQAVATGLTDDQLLPSAM